MSKQLRPIWSISVSKGKTFEDLFKAGGFSEPILTAGQVTDIKAEFIADPFIVQENSTYFLFFEVLGLYDQKGRISMAASNDGVLWHYERIVLEESFHLSYPYVFQHENRFYMIPDNNSGYIKLYKAVNFPYEWEFSADLLKGIFADASILHKDGMFWLFAEQADHMGRRNGNLHLYYSERLDSGWTEHPQSPLYTDRPECARPAGRVLEVKGENLRFSQDDKAYYGRCVNLHKIERLTVCEYKETVMPEILKGSGLQGDWRKDGMHHIDCCLTAGSKWLAVADGHYFREMSLLRRKWFRLTRRLADFLKRRG